MTARYVAGLGMDGGAPQGYLVRLEETENGDRLGAYTIAQDMTVEQVEHLHMQVGNLLKIMKPRPAAVGKDPRLLELVDNMPGDGAIEHFTVTRDDAINLATDAYGLGWQDAYEEASQ